jgi:hypothetical protein
MLKNQHGLIFQHGRHSMSDVMHAIIGDIRCGARQLGRNLPLTIAALLCFALGVGANTSIFSVVNAVLFRPLPFPDSDKLVMVSEGIPKLAADINDISAADLLDYKEVEGRTFQSLALVQQRGTTISVNGDAEAIPGASITPSDMIRLIVGQAVGLAAIGVAIGLAGAFALTRVMRALLFNTDPLDGITFGASATVLLLIAVLSSYLPAWRALRIDPTIAMRAE